MTSRVPAERVLASVLEDEFSHPNHQRNWLAITIAATNPSHPAHEFFMARKQRMRQYLNGGQLAMLNDGETVTAEEKVTMVLAMIDGLRIQSLLDPDRPVLPLLERFVRMISTNEA